MEESYNDIKYPIGNNKDNSNNSVNLRNSVTSAANLLIAIFKNCKKMYRRAYNLNTSAKATRVSIIYFSPSSRLIFFLA